MQRSGTSLLDAALSQNPCINMGYELFHGDGAAEFWDAAKLRKAIELYFNLDKELTLQSKEEIAFFESTPEYFQHAIRGTNVSRLVRGFDWMVNGALFDVWQWFAEYCCQHGVKIIWLHSRHFLRQYISDRVQIRLTKKPSRQKLKLPVKDMLKTIEIWSNLNSHMKNLLISANLAGVTTLALDYEDLTPHMLDTAQTFTVNDTECKSIPETKFGRIASEQIHKVPIKKMVKNWAEVYATLISTRFSWLLND